MMVRLLSAAWIGLNRLDSMSVHANYDHVQTRIHARRMLAMQDE